MSYKSVMLLVNVTSLIYPRRKSIAEHRYSWERLPHTWAHLKSKPKPVVIESTGAIHGIIGCMDWVSNMDARYGACIFDGDAATTRSNLYPAYKSYSSIQDEKITPQLDPIKTFLKFTGWPIISIPQYEADDVIGTMVEHAKSKGINVLIVSGDENILQLLGTGVKAIVSSPWDGPSNICTHELLEQEFSISPRLLPDVLALMGDKEKGVPGIAGIGQKTAIKLIKKHGSIESILNNISGIDSKYAGVISENIDSVRTALFLNTIKTDCNLPVECLIPLRQQAPIAKESVNELIHYLEDYGIYDNGNIKTYASNRLKTKLTPEADFATNSGRTNKVHYVYRIRNKITNRIYFGSTTNIERRWREHRTELGRGTHANERMQTDFLLHGIDSFIFKKMYTEENLAIGLRREQFYITNFYGRTNCYNREAYVKGVDISPSTCVLIAEHVSFKKQSPRMRKELAGESTLKKGWGSYLSIHAASKELRLSKEKIIEAISKGEVCGDWIFTQHSFERKKTNHLIFQ